MEVKQDQIIVHLTSHGTKAITDDTDDANNQFTNYVRAPIKKINKIGLLYATVPKVINTIDETNNSFFFVIQFADGTQMIRDVHLPIVNYYPDFSGKSCVVDEDLEKLTTHHYITPDNKGTANRVNFCEALMWAMNQALDGVGQANAAESVDSGVRCLVYLIHGKITIVIGKNGDSLSATPAAVAMTTKPDGIGFFNMSKRVQVMLGAEMHEPSFRNFYTPVRIDTEEYDDAGNWNGPIPLDNGDPAAGMGAVPHSYGRGVQRIERFDTDGEFYGFEFDHPPELMPPNFIMLQCHTTGTKNLSLGHQAERACWSLLLDNKDWRHTYKNTGVRQCDDPVDHIAEFYPDNLEYNNCVVSNGSVTAGLSTSHRFSFVTPNWGHCKVPESTI